VTPVFHRKHYYVLRAGPVLRSAVQILAGDQYPDFSAYFPYFEKE
jgi:hypothetical protein